MGKALIIAEKPSVAADIAKAIGGFSKEKDFFESPEYVLSSAVGHLVQLAVPEGHEVKRGKWSLANLPVIPPHFDLLPIEKSQDRLKLLAKLIKRKDVDLLINACDAGREGELIFRYIVRYVGSKKPIKRLWLQSMTAGSIRDGFKALREDRELLPLADAAVSRSEADWLVGINGTRAMTAFNSKGGGFFLTTVGRVQTPTLAIVVDREEKIKRFVFKDYWEVLGTFGAKAGEYVGRWFDENFQKSKEAEGADLKAERLWDQAKAEAIRAKCEGKTGVVTEESKPTTSLPPTLYDLTSLQRDANSRFGFSASTTLKIAQALYEKHKVLTYPRTDARALPEDYIPTVHSTLEMLVHTPYAMFANQILQQDWVKPNKRIFNNAKISDHFAIIPTSNEPKNLNEIEAKLYDMVAKRFLAIFFPAAESLVTTRITRVMDEAFKTEGKVLMKPGWMAVYGREAEQDEQSPTLPKVEPNETVNTIKVEVNAHQTKPPARFTEATLLTAMEGAGKLIEDEELRDAMQAKGLGTPATRAAIIEGLLYEKYLLRNGRELVPTPKAFSLIALLRGLQLPELIAPELTGDWEFKLRQIERGQLQRKEFMDEIGGMTKAIVWKTKQFQGDTIPGDFGTLKVRCPKCGGEVRETYKTFQCEKGDFSIYKILGGRMLEPAEAEELITNRTIGPLQGFRSKAGKPFASILKLGDDFKIQFDFGQSNESDEPVDFSGQEPVGKCPSCGANVYEHGMSYICEKAVGKDRTCQFRSGKVILQQAIDRAQMQKLLSTGKTDLLPRFISKKNRPFQAFLVVKDKKTAFEFQPRPEKLGQKGARGGKPKEEEKYDFTGQEPIGKCPKCSGKVFETANNYVCENVQAEKKPCKFKSGKTILQQPIDREQMVKLLSKGKTDVMDKFVSKAGNNFAAYLVVNEDGKVSFEFPPREELEATGTFGRS
ncbi:MAG TPA: DNA topoisomerase III [Candidatus Binatia bacterium]|nr:DNA topoisomerase III [Candidatus Binatia bacterium]